MSDILLRLIATKIAKFQHYVDLKRMELDKEIISERPRMEGGSQIVTQLSNQYGIEDSVTEFGFTSANRKHTK